jgi:hypothetical protein
MSRAPAVSQKQIERTLRALKAVGERIASVKNEPGGCVSILTPDGKEIPVSPLEAWERENAGHAA